MSDEEMGFEPPPDLPPELPPDTQPELPNEPGEFMEPPPDADLDQTAAEIDDVSADPMEDDFSPSPNNDPEVDGENQLGTDPDPLEATAADGSIGGIDNTKQMHPKEWDDALKQSENNGPVGEDHVAGIGNSLENAEKRSQEEKQEQPPEDENADEQSQESDSTEASEAQGNGEHLTREQVAEELDKLKAEEKAKKKGPA